MQQLLWTYMHLISATFLGFWGNKQSTDFPVQSSCIRFPTPIYMNPWLAQLPQLPFKSLSPEKTVWLSLLWFLGIGCGTGAFCTHCSWQGGQTGPAMVEHQNLALFLSPTLRSFESCYTEEPSLRIINRATGMGCAIRTLCLPCLDWNVQALYDIGSNPLSAEKSPFSFRGSRSRLLKRTAMAKHLQEIQSS